MWIIFALSASIIWGLNYTLNAKLLKSVNASSLILGQMLFGSILFFLFTNKEKLFKDVSYAMENKEFLYLFFITTVFAFIAQLCIYRSISLKNAVLASFIETCYPLFTLFFSWLLFKDNLCNTPTIVGGMLIFFGIFIISK